MSDDIVKRLREKGAYGFDAPDDYRWQYDADCREAADEIERLRAEVKELEHAIVYAPNDRMIGPHDCQRCGIGPLVTGPLCPWCSERWVSDDRGGWVETTRPGQRT